jgi:hypothetical protein
LSSDEEDEAIEDHSETTLTEDGAEVKLEASGKYINLEDIMYYTTPPARAEASLGFFF